MDGCVLARYVCHTPEAWAMIRDRVDERCGDDLGAWMEAWSMIRVEDFPGDKRAVTFFAPELRG